MINFDKIIDDIFVGTCPISIIDVQRLKQAGMSAILNLQTDRDFSVTGINWPMLEQYYHQNQISSYRYPIIDFDDIDMTNLLPGAVDLLQEMVAKHSRIYVHCTAGKQRSPSAVIGYLAWCKGHGLQSALDIVMAARNCGPPVHVLENIDMLYRQYEQDQTAPRS